MDKDRIEGTAKQVKGSVKKAIGKVTDNKSLQVEGEIDKAEGTVQENFGKAKEALNDD